MTALRKKIVLDANILVRGVLGERVPDLLTHYHRHILFYTPAQCFLDARTYLPEILYRRGHVDTETALQALDALALIVQSVDSAVYRMFEMEARQRIHERDIDDWPLIALSMTLDCPIWTEDKDFFGTGVATWRTRTVEIYLSD